MLCSAQVRIKISLLLGISLAIAALYHVAGLFYNLDDSSVLRHAIFIGLDLFCVYGFLKRPKYFILFFMAFTLQQYYTHGQYIIEMWISNNKIHWISVSVLVLLPIGLLFLIVDLWHSSIQSIFSNPNAK